MQLEMNEGQMWTHVVRHQKYKGENIHVYMHRKLLEGSTRNC